MLLAGWLAPVPPCPHQCQPCRFLQPPALVNPCPQVTAAITYLRSENMCYPACTNKVDGTRQCNKKLQDNGDGTWCVCLGGAWWVQHGSVSFAQQWRASVSEGCTVYQGSKQAAK